MLKRTKVEVGQIRKWDNYPIYEKVTFVDDVFKVCNLSIMGGDDSYKSRSDNYEIKTIAVENFTISMTMEEYFQEMLET